MRLFGYFQTLWRRSDDEIEFLWQNHDWDVNPFFALHASSKAFSQSQSNDFLSNFQACYHHNLTNESFIYRFFKWLMDRSWFKSLIKINFSEVFSDHFLNFISHSLRLLLSLNSMTFCGWQCIVMKNNRSRNSSTCFIMTCLLQ